MEQLQKTLNEAIRMWWEPRSSSEQKPYAVKSWDNWVSVWWWITHNLFSKESWLMEFMDWKDLHLTLDWVAGHYINMCMMTAQEKIDYFNNNAYLPWKQ